MALRVKNVGIYKRLRNEIMELRKVVSLSDLDSKAQEIQCKGHKLKRKEIYIYIYTHTRKLIHSHLTFTTDMPKCMRQEWTVHICCAGDTVQKK